LKEFSHHIIIKKEHLDVFGHVNNAEYLRLYEEARWKLIHQEGLDEKTVVAEQIGPVILNINVSFKKEILLDEKIEIKLTDTFIKNRYLYVIKQAMIKDNGDIASEIELLLGLMDLKKRKLIEPDSRWLGALGL